MYKLLVIMFARDIVEASSIPHGSIVGRNVHSQVIEFDSLKAAEVAFEELMKTYSVDGVGVNQVIRLYR